MEQGNKQPLLYPSTSAQATESLDIFSQGHDVLFIPADKYESLKNQIKDFVELPENWDGYGAVPVFPAIGNTADQLLAILSDTFIERISDVFPNPHGTIAIEWENRNKEKLALEIGKENYSYFVRYKDRNPKLHNGKDVLSDVKKLTSDLADLFSEEIQKYFLP